MLPFNDLNFSQFVLVLLLLFQTSCLTLLTLLTDARVVQFEQTAWIVLIEPTVCRHSLA